MATPKEYELLFLLKAQMENSFASNFSAARGQLVQLQDKVREYQATLKDISAYQASEAKLESYKAKLAEAEEKLRAVSEQNRNAATTTTEMQNAEQRAKDEVERLTQKVTEQEAALAKQKDNLEASGVETDDLSKSTDELKDKIEATKQEMDSWASFQNTLTDLASGFSVLNSVASEVGETVSKVTDFLWDCLDAAAELEYTMSAVEAVSGATADETEQLTALAKEMGATTVYTASECAEALQTEALAGWSVEEMLAGLPAVVSLAAASGEDLTEMSSIISDSLNAFGLSGEEAVNRFADVLTTAATSSNTTVSLMGESLSYVESTASNLGYSIEDVSVALAAMANSALKGGVSGTALNTMLTRMSGANSTAAAEMEKLNLSMYDTEGNAKSLSQFLGELRDAFNDGTMSEEEMQVAAYNLAGQRGMRGLLSIVNTSEESWAELTEEINNAEGAAESVADTRLDNYTGQVTLLESAWDALKTSIGEAFIPVATDAASILTDITTAADGFVQEHPEVVYAITAVVGVLGAMAAVIGVTTAAVTLLNTATNILSASMMALMGQFAIVGVIAAVGAGLITLVANIDNTSDAVKALGEEVDNITASAEETIESNEELLASYQEERDEANKLVDTLDSLTASGEDNAWTQWQIQAAVDDLNEAVPDLNLSYDELNGTLSMTTEEMRDFIAAASEDELEDYASALNTTQAELEAIEDEIAIAQAAYDAALADWDSNSIHLFGSEQDIINFSSTDDIEATKAALEELLQDEADLEEQEAALQAAIEEHNQAVEEEYDLSVLSAEEYEEIQSSVEALTTAYSEAYAAAYESISGQYELWDTVEDIETNTVSSLQESLQSQIDYWTNYQENLQTLIDSGLDFGSMWDSLSDGSEDAAATVQGLADELNANGTAGVQELIDTYSELQDTMAGTADTIAENDTSVKDALADSIALLTEYAGGEGMEEASEAVATVILGMAETASTTAEEQSVAISAAFTDMADEAGQAFYDELTAALGTYTVPEELSAAVKVSSGDLGLNFSEGFAEGISTATSEEAVQALAEDALSQFQQQLGENSPSTITAEDGVYFAQGFENGLLAEQAALNSVVASLATSATTTFQANLPQSAFYTAGQNAIQGAINGIQSKQAALVAAAAAAGTAAANAYKKAQDINSPSRLFEYYGEMGMMGAIQGVQENQTAVNAAYAAAGTESAAAYRSGTEQTEAAQSSATLSTESSSYNVIQLTYSPTVTVNGDSGSGVSQQLAASNEELVTMLNDLLDEREAQMARRSY
ncbi:MAG: phage tail tape measure protein [Clostridiales bacterium]|nr:phage tail tape measure protein [Clostridiales bacterium]